ncbi:hypothetical protein N1851_024154 [Merluccius polli]|uniref:Uncharacterized protein n=1 Tax=Merluccius polli TaxID=89951 RepID=A0AA47MFB6_MERPO|nr:hypothetical protein N1851_024154 [Merluccius polli]
MLQTKTTEPMSLADCLSKFSSWFLATKAVARERKTPPLIPCRHADSFKQPIIIPKEHHVTMLIIAHNHEKTKHQGKGFTPNKIRSNGYWIPGMNQANSGDL